MSKSLDVVASNPSRKNRYLDLAKTSDEKFMLKAMIPFILERGIDITNFRIDIVNFIMSYTLKTYRFIRMLHRTYKAESVFEGHLDDYKLNYFFSELVKTIEHQLLYDESEREIIEDIIKKHRTSCDASIIPYNVLSIYLVHLFLNDPNGTLKFLSNQTIKDNLTSFYLKLFADNARFAPSNEVMKDILYFCGMEFNEIANMFAVYKKLIDVIADRSSWEPNLKKKLPDNNSLKDAENTVDIIDRITILKNSFERDVGLPVTLVHYHGMFPLDKEFSNVTLNSKDYIYTFIGKLRRIEWNYYLLEAHNIYKEYFKTYLKQLELPRIKRTAIYDVSYNAITSYIHATEGMFEDGSFIHFIDGIRYVEDGRRNLPIFTKPFTIDYLQSDRILKNFIASRMEKFNSHDAYEYEETRQRAIKDFENRMDDYEKHSSIKPYTMQELFTDFIAKYRGRSFTKNQLDWGERFKTYNDGLFWEFLPEGRSEKERDAMSHCGNMGRTIDYMFSLRSEKKGKYKVHITVTITRDGYLLETKSYGNSEPSEKYHNHLIDLYINSPLIKCVGNEFDGHKSEVNFTFKKFTHDQKKLVIQHKPLAMINKYDLFESLVNEINLYQEYIKEEGHNEIGFNFWEVQYDTTYVKKEILFHDQRPLAVFDFALVGNEIDGKMGVFPYQLQNLTMMAYMETKELFIKILEELVSYFDEYVSSRELMISNSFMAVLNDVITTLPIEWENDIVSSSVIEKIKEINKNYVSDFIKYKCVEISRDIRGDEWFFDDQLNYVRFFDFSEDFLIFFNNLFAGGKSELESLINDTLDDSTERGFDVEVSKYEMRENSISSHKFWDEFKKIETVKKMNESELSNFYSWFHNFENVLQNDRRPIEDYEYKYYEFYKNLDFKNPVAVTSNIWMILFNAKETAIASCLEASSYESFKDSVVGYVMNPENFHNSEDKFRINNYWTFDEVEIEGEKKYKMSFDTQRFVKEFFSNQSEFEYEGIELEIDTNWMAEKNTRRRDFEIDSYVDHDQFVSEFSYRMFDDDISDEVIEYMKKNKCSITSSSQLNEPDEDNE